MHAFLVLAHDDPRMCERLTERLSRSGEVYVHIDAKSRLADFEQVRRHAHVIPARLPIYWGGWNMTTASALLASRALEDSSVSRITLLSGRHYPLVPAETLAAAAYSDVEKIRMITVPDATAGKPESRFRDRYISRFAPSTFASVVANGVARRLPGQAYEDVLDGNSLYAGSTWWSLTRDTYERAVALLDRNKGLTQYFQRIAAPDESAFHTAVGAGLEAEHRALAPDLVERETTFVSWAGGRHPEPLDAALVDRAHAEGWWFARKFGSDRPELIEHAEAISH